MGNQKDEIIACRYQYNIWQKIFPMLNEAFWENAMQPNSYHKFINGTINIANLSNEKYKNYSKLKIVTIDEDYFKFLNENNLNDSASNRYNYATNLPDKIVEAKFKKNNWGKDYTLLSLDLTIFTNNRKDQTISLTKEEILKLKSQIKKIYKGANVFVPGYILDDNLYKSLNSYILKLSKEYFSGRRIQINKKLTKYEYRKTKNGYIHLIIPFVINYNYKSATINLSELEDKKRFQPENIILDNDILKTLHNIFDKYKNDNTKIIISKNVIFGKKHIRLEKKLNKYFY